MRLERLRKYFLGLTPPFLVEQVRRRWPAPHDLYRAECARLMRLPRNTPSTTTIAGRRITVLDGRTAAGTITRLFGPQRKAYFETARATPLIIDCGANIGLTVLYWKTILPNARVVAFEADPEVFKVLEDNCAGLADVTLVRAAVWSSDGACRWTANGNDGGALTPDPTGAVSNTSGPGNVRTVRLRPYLDQPVDLLKIDIEGAEATVVPDIAEALPNVAHVMLEYHSLLNEEQRLDELLTCLRNAGFRIHLENPDHAYASPLLRSVAWNGKDLHLEIYGRRDPLVRLVL